MTGQAEFGGARRLPHVGSQRGAVVRGKKLAVVTSWFHSGDAVTVVSALWGVWQGLHISPEPVSELKSWWVSWRPADAADMNRARNARTIGSKRGR